MSHQISNGFLHGFLTGRPPFFRWCRKLDYPLNKGKRDRKSTKEDRQLFFTIGLLGSYILKTWNDRPEWITSKCMTIQWSVLYSLLALKRFGSHKIIKPPKSPLDSFSMKFACPHHHFLHGRKHKRTRLVSCKKTTAGFLFLEDDSILSFSRHLSSVSSRGLLCLAFFFREKGPFFLRIAQRWGGFL